MTKIIDVFLGLSLGYFLAHIAFAIFMGRM